jgi:NAD+ kinase
MKPKRALLATKKTALENFKERSDDFGRRLPADELQRIRVAHEEHYATLALATRLLTERGIDVERSYMPYAAYEDFISRDLVVTVGGDGTVLNASHYILGRTPVLAVRSDEHSTGALCATSARGLEAALDRLLGDDFEVELWTRASVAVDGKRVLALNEVYIGDLYAPGMARYELSLGRISEIQASSGLIVSTGTGSTGWYRNASGLEPFPRIARGLRFAVREPLVDGAYRLTGGEVREGEALRVRSMMNVDGCVSLDGDKHKRAYPFERGATAEVSVADEPLAMVRL